MAGWQCIGINWIVKQVHICKASVCEYYIIPAIAFYMCLVMLTAGYQCCYTQECRDTARAQASVISQLREADAENAEALELIEDKWSAAVQDAATVVQSKEDQLQAVRNHCQQTEALKSALEELTAELEAVNM